MVVPLNYICGQSASFTLYIKHYIVQVGKEMIGTWISAGGRNKVGPTLQSVVQLQRRYEQSSEPEYQEQ